MARTITDEQIKLSVIIDGNPAQKELHSLEKAIRDLNTEQKDLRKEKKLLETQGLKETARYKEVTASIKENSAALLSNKARMSALQNEIGLTGLTMAQLRSKATALRVVLNNLVPGSADYKRYEADLNQVSARISELRGKATAAKWSIGGMADSFNRYAALGASAIAVGTGMVLSIQKIIDISGKLADAQSDVMKTTGMSKNEVDELTKSFGMLQTRTSRMDLLSIAEEGGRIGVLKEDIGDFVKVMDKASVALGDSFTGGAEEVSNKLGKIKFLFQETKNLGIEETYNSIGSAINELGANGAATENNIAEFTTRIGALSDVMKPTVAETMALGAAFEESGIEAEVSARAYSIFLKQASTESAKFAQVMGISQKEVEKMINDDPLQFFLKFSETLSKNAKNGVEMAKALDYLGLGADGVNKIVGAAGNNVARFGELVDVSNKAFTEGTSLIDEYNIKNNNLAATLEKIQKRVMGFVTPEGFVNWLGDVTNWFGKFIGATEDADGSVTAWKNTLFFAAKVIAIVTAAMVTHVAWQKLVVMWTTRNAESTLLYNIASKARAVTEAIGIIVTQGAAAAQMLLSGNVKGATQAIRVMNTVIKSSPWGFALAALAAIVVAYQVFKEEAKQAASKQSILNDTLKEADAIVKKETASLNILLKIAQDETASKEARQRAIEAINKISPEYLGNLTLENIKTAEGKKILDSYILSLRKRHELEILTARQKKLMEEMDSRKNKSLQDEIKWYDELWAAAKNPLSTVGAASDLIILSTERRSKALKELQDELGLTEDQMKKYLQANPSLMGNGKEDEQKGLAIDLGNGAQKTPGTKTAKKYDDSYLKDEEKMRKELLDLQQKSEVDRIANLGEGYAKELELENANHTTKLQNYTEASNDIKKLRAQLVLDEAAAEKAGDTKKVTSLQNQQGLLIQKQAEMDAQVEYQEQMHNLKIGTIQEKAGKDSINKEKETYDQAKLNRETAFLEELNGLDLSEIEKTKRKEQFEKEELKHQEEFLKAQITKYKDILSEEALDGITFNLLTEEQKDKIALDLEVVLNALAKIQAAQNGDTENDSNKEVDLGLGGETDILGFTKEQWEGFLLNIENGTIGFQTMQMAIGLAQQMFGQMDQYMTASENAQLKTYERNQDARKRKLKQQLDTGFINQTQYKKGIEEIDKDLDKKKADLEYKQAKRQRLMAIANIVMNTAQAIIGIWAQFPKFDFGATAAVMSGVVGALGAVQLATVLKTPLPAKGYEDGLYSSNIVKREQDGKLFKAKNGGRTKSGMVNEPTYFLAGENYKPEMVIDSQAYRDLSPSTRNLLVNELRGIKGFENGYYSPTTQRIEIPQNQNANNDATTLNNDIVIRLLSKNIEVLEKIEANGLIAIVSTKDTKSIKALREALKDYEKLRNKNIQ